MTKSDDPPPRVVIGLAPALIVEKPIRFGPIGFEPICEASSHALDGLARRFANERGASEKHQALVTIDSWRDGLIPTLWSLFMFACVSYARRDRPSRRGVAMPENFYIAPVTPSPNGLVFDSGHTIGIGLAEHVPLRWPVDRALPLHAGNWDRRLELACSVVASGEGATFDTPALRATGMAASLACAALERRTEKIMNVETAARSTILLGSAFEALHCRGTDTHHSHADVVRGVERLEGASTTLPMRLFEAPKRGECPEAREGSDLTRPMYVVAHLVYVRNQFAHGRIPPNELFALPAEFADANLIHAATGVLAALLGDDVSKELGCVVPEDSGDELAVAERLGLGWDPVHSALVDGRQLLASLERMLVPPPKRPS